MTAEQRRCLAVEMAAGGDAPEEVAEVLGVSSRSVWRWLAITTRQGDGGLATRPGQGRPCKLSAAQSDQVLGWLRQNPVDFGFITERWTCRRLAGLIADRFGVHMNHRYLSAWLTRRGLSPQIPETIPRERDEGLIRRWIARDWPIIKKKRGHATPA